MKKRIVLFMLTAIFAITIISCNKDDDNSSTPLPPEKDDVCSAMDDTKFKEYCLKNFDTNKDGKISIAEANAVTIIDVGNSSIISLKGIEYFTNLNGLYCSENQLTNLDVSKNSALTSLYCYRNQLTSLDVNKNTALTELYCYNNQLSVIALNNIFGALPNLVGSSSAPTTLIGDNPGTNSCDKSIAKNKGWNVF